MSAAYFYLTGEGEALARRLAAAHPGDLYGKENFKAQLKNAFGRYEELICIMATGIVVRILAPLIVHKTSDPAVVVLDQRGQYAISLLSGHLGGANDLAREMAFLCGGEAVITTATDVAGELSFDTFAKKRQMAIENIGQLKYISGALLDKKPIRVITDGRYPELIQAAAEGKMELCSVKEYESEGRMQWSGPECCPSGKKIRDGKQSSEDFGEKKFLPTVVIHEGYTLPGAYPAPVLYLRPRTICAGIGCKRGMDGGSIEAALRTTLKKEGLHPLSVKCISTIPLKADEDGILTTANHLGVPVEIVPTEDIDALDIDSLGIQTSDFVAGKTGVLSVSTASAYLASGKGTILKDKEKYKGITIALCKTKESQSSC